MKWILLFLPSLVFAVCDTTISRTNNGANSVLTSAKYNTDLNTVYTRANNLPGDCIVDGSIDEAKLADGAVTPAKLSASFGALNNGLRDGCKVAFDDTTLFLLIFVDWVLTVT